MGRLFAFCFGESLSELGKSGEPFFSHARKRGRKDPPVTIERGATLFTSTDFTPALSGQTTVSLLPMRTAETLKIRNSQSVRIQTQISPASSINLPFPHPQNENINTHDGVGVRPHIY